MNFFESNQDKGKGKEMAAHGHTAQTHNGINKGNEWKTEPGETKKER